jgi:hypothetical protein
MPRNPAPIFCRQIVESYDKLNLSVDQIRMRFHVQHVDPLKEFSAACRAELYEFAHSGR